ncbi:MAG: cell division FtsZ family protein [Patescibacteria group bacterium]|nr:cell division FtsZ family protein [Patescibacteria group bacterium]
MPKAVKKAPLKKKKTVVKRRSPKKSDLDSARRIKMRILGVGGGAGNIISEVSFGVSKVDFVAANTDTQALKGISKKVRSFAFGQEFTHGLGAGMDARVGEAAAKAEKERIKKLFEGQDFCVIVASLGGGTGSGATPIFAEAARESKCITIGIFTLPFSFEGEKRRQIAESALERLKPLLNSYVVIPNEKIFNVIDKSTPLPAALSVVNKRLADSLEGLIETIYLPGLINVDFADLRSVLDGRGRLGYLNSIQASGENKAQEGSEDVLNSRLGEYGISGADRILFNITSDKSLRMQEVAEISKTISDSNPRARIIFGISFRSDFKNKLRITLLAIGCNDKKEEKEALKKKKPKRKKIIKEPEEKKEEKPEPALKPKKKKVVKKTAKLKKKVPRKSKPAPSPQQSPVMVRKNALDLKKEVDEELKNIEEEEKKWDIPSFLRNRSQG